MLSLRHRSFYLLSLALIAALFAGALAAQQTTGILKGTVTDESGAMIPAARITITGPGGVRKNVQSQADGTYTLVGLPPGTYTVRLTLPGFVQFQQQVEVSAAKTVQLDIALHVQAEKQEVTVKAEPGPQVSVEPDNNAGALVLRGADLDSLSDDPDDLAADLQALAGPSAGPNGGQIFIDGFSGGQLPPKENIREIRINQNPFSSEYDQLGYGRIEILTKPGTDKFHGSVFFTSSDNVFNSRYPYSPNKPDYISKMFEGSVTGPVTKKSSFTFGFERRDTSDDAVVTAQGLDTNLLPIPISLSVPTPSVRTSLGPRFDYALSTNNTIVGRYTYQDSAHTNQGVSQFSLPSRGYNTDSTEHRFQVTETSILGPKVVNETRVQFLRSMSSQSGDNTIPSINVSSAFNGGGAQVGHNNDTDTRWEIQNNTTTTKKTHTVRFGVRVRFENERNLSPVNFGGSFTFAGGIGPILDANNQPVVDPSVCSNVRTNVVPAGCQQVSSLERYRRTLLFNSLGLTPAQMLPLGAGASLFTLNAGTALADVNQTDIGAFIQDDWRVRPNLTVSLGIRYETQTNISDYRDWAPRLGVAWAPGARGGRQPKTVIRGGSGFFYTRFDNGYALDTQRFNGILEQSYSIVNPTFSYLASGATGNNPNFIVPTPSTLSARPSAIHVTDSNLHAPLIWQSAIGVERQLPRNTTIATTFTYSKGTHMLDSRDINSPLVPGGPRPYAGNEIFLYESAGIFNQKMLMVNINTRATKAISLFGYYTLGYTNSDTDSAKDFPANQYSMISDYGRSSLDSRHHIFVGGTISAPLKVRFSPYVSASSGRPFDITTGRDFYGDSLYTDRPSFAAPGTPGAIVTQWGTFNPNPGPNDPRIPRNFAEGPGYVSISLRMSRTWGFGPKRGGSGFTSGSGDGGPGSGDHGDHGSRGGGSRGGSSGGGRGGPGGGGGMRMGGSGGRSMFGDSGSTEHRFNLTLGCYARNLINHMNPGSPIGNLTSPLFGQSTTIYSFGGGPGGGYNSQAYNRRIELSLRLSF